MGDSTDADPPDGLDGSEESSRAVLTSWLDDFAAGRSEREDLEEAFLSVCGADPEAPWDALALLDQYQRLGRIDAAVARQLKAKIAQSAIGSPKPGAARPQRVSPVAHPSGGAGGTHATTSEQLRDDAHTDDIATPAVRAALRPSQPAASAHENEEPEEESEEEDDEEAPPAVRRQPAGKPLAAALSAAPTDSVEPALGITANLSRTARAGQRREPRVRALDAPAAALRVLRGRYELLTTLARGNTSTVYKAFDRHRANLVEDARYVAIKVLDANIDVRPETKAQLEREFHQAQSLSHPNIASVFDLDRDGSTYFIVMELLEGELLSTVLHRLDGRPMQRAHALSVIGSIGAALSYAHRRDIVHGDLKPRNVMITSDGEVRVLEFGFAHSRALQAGEIDADHDTVAIGAPGYASAERVHGFEPQPTDDVYSLACIAYELLSGRHPYGGRSGLLARAHGKRPARIAGLTHRQWQALQRALVWDRAERKIEVAELLSALGASGGSGAAIPPELLAIPEDVSARRRRMWQLAALVVACVVGAAYFVTRIPPPPQSAERATAAATLEDPGMTADAAPAVSDTRPTEEVVAQTVAPARPASRDSSIEGEQQSTAPAVPPAATDVPASPAETRPGVAAQPATIQFAKDTYVVTENQPAAAIEVVRTGSLRQPLTFRWNVRSNSAEAGSDFAAIGPGLEQIPAGARSATILIPLINDSIVENTELFLVDLEPGTEGIMLGEISHAAVIIVDDD